MYDPVRRIDLAIGSAHAHFGAFRPVTNVNGGARIAGLMPGFHAWQIGFMSVGGERFGMWMSKQWNGVPDAFRFSVTILLVLTFVAQRDEETV